jgi:subtilase family serine protease
VLTLEFLETRMLPQAGNFTPLQILHAYGIDQIKFGSVTGNGAGQTVAIVDPGTVPDLVGSTDPSFNSSDLHIFDQQYGIPDPPSFKIVNQTGGSTLPTTVINGAEECADVEYAHAIAPMANILLVEENSNFYTDYIGTPGGKTINGGVDVAEHTSNVSVISMSFGGTEFSGETSFDSFFRTPTGHQGITFVACSQDYGAPGAYMAYNPNVLAVGGTTLMLNANNTIQSETGWGTSFGGSGTGGSGGGISQFEKEPAYQNGLVIHNGGNIVNSGGFRAEPDVAFLADGSPGTGDYAARIVDLYDGYTLFSGTSLGAPCWAGLMAIADQGRALRGLGTLDSSSSTTANNPIARMYSLPGSDFHDITSGTSTGTPNYTAAPGYDLVTGLGSPVANQLVDDLAGFAKTTTKLSSSVNPSVFGQSVTFTATVSASIRGTGVPTGSVTFKNGATALGTVTLASGTATLRTTNLSVGTDSITVVYNGNAEFTGSTSSALSQTVKKDGTRTTVVSSMNPSVSGHAVTFTARVTASAPGTKIPTGKVNFDDGSTLLGSGTLSASGQATFTTSTLAGGTHSITAVYVGSASYTTSKSAVLTQTVNHAVSAALMLSGLGQTSSFPTRAPAQSESVPGKVPLGTWTLRASDEMARGGEPSSETRSLASLEGDGKSGTLDADLDVAVSDGFFASPRRVGRAQG